MTADLQALSQGNPMAGGRGPARFWDYYLSKGGMRGESAVGNFPAIIDEIS